MLSGRFVLRNSVLSGLFSSISDKMAGTFSCRSHKLQLLLITLLPEFTSKELLLMCSYCTLFVAHYAHVSSIEALDVRNSLFRTSCVMTHFSHDGIFEFRMLAC